MPCRNPTLKFFVHNPDCFRRYGITPSGWREPATATPTTTEKLKGKVASLLKRKRNDDATDACLPTDLSLIGTPGEPSTIIFANGYRIEREASFIGGYKLLKQDFQHVKYAPVPETPKVRSALSEKSTSDIDDLALEAFKPKTAQPLSSRPDSAIAFEPCTPVFEAWWTSKPAPSVARSVSASSREKESVTRETRASESISPSAEPVKINDALELRSIGGVTGRYPPARLSKSGDPLLTLRRAYDWNRPEYKPVALPTERETSTRYKMSRFVEHMEGI